ncbi:hypothetical protein [Streptomyces sp. SID3343]|uniref:hypothetical protein n=1 Tax=Streptomyces sp. SID3343 TaxID=2690260 RepID=UPI001370B262|nr:hypothetical protein [Streptomyces sp. SID3343]MYV99382.1 hypothetical protein [Streptomyces sp. SID3343]
MNRKGITRGDAIVILAVVLIFIFSFFNYYEISLTERGSSSDDGDMFSSGNTSTKGWNAWTVNFFPLMPAVVLVPALALVLAVIGRFVAQPDRPVLGLALRQWAIAFGVTGAISGFFAPFGAGGAIGDLLEEIAPSRAGVDSGPTVFAWLMMVCGLVAALFLIVGDRMPGLAAPLFSPVPQQQWGYLPPPNATGGYPPPNVSGAYPPPGAYPGAPAPGAPMAGVPAHVPQQAPTGSSNAAAPAAPLGVGSDAQEFAQFWFAVPEARALAPSEGLDKTPVATLETGQWYLAVAPHPGGVLVEADGVRGVLSDVSGIQRGE